MPQENAMAWHPDGVIKESAIPEEIRNRRAWCPFRFELRDGKPTKIPYNARTGRRAKSNSPKTWSSFREAAQAVASSERYDGVEYMLSREDSYFLLDLDGCRNPSSGEITPEARRIIAPFKDKAFIEASTSGRGVHVFGRGTKPGAKWCRNSKLGIELYDWGRPVVFTGNVLEGSTSDLLADCQPELDRLYHECMPEHLKSPSAERIREDTQPSPVDLPDEELLQKAASSKYGAEFQALMRGDTSSTGGDHSRADYRLMRELLYWTGGDKARALALFDRSGLAQREKWRRRPDYRSSTARKARMSLTSFYRAPAESSGSKTAQLKDAVRDLRHRWWSFEWASLLGTSTRANSMRGHTCRDVMKVLIDALEKHGKVSGEEVRVSLGRRAIALRAATSLRTIHKAIKHLEAEGWLKFEPPASEEKPGTYVFLRASVHHTQDLHTEGVGLEEKAGAVGGGEGLRAPRLRWSSPAYKPRRGVVRGTRKVRESKPRPPRDRIERLGKIRGAVVDVLDDAGGLLSVDELYARLHPEKSAADRRRWRPRDLKRRQLPMLEEAGIIAVEGDVVRLTDDWPEALENARRLGQEIDHEAVGGVVEGAETIARRRHRLEREAFRRRREIKPDKTPTPAEMEAQRERFKAALDRQKHAREERMRVKALEAFNAPNSGPAKNLALFIDGELVNVQTLVQSVLHHHGVPLVRWGELWERWRDPVLAAAASLVRAPEHPPPEPEPPPGDGCSDSLDCDCFECSTSMPQYARPRRGRRTA